MKKKVFGYKISITYLCQSKCQRTQNTDVLLITKTFFYCTIFLRLIKITYVSEEIVVHSSSTT